MDIREILNREDSFRYQMLGRLQSDMDYYFGNGNRNESDLWAGNFDKQISYMRQIYNSFDEKPDWITLEEIEGYASKGLKKSIPSIHDMIAQTRANNNSLVKSRVDLNIRKNNNRSVREILNEGMNRRDKQLRPMTLSDRDGAYKFKMVLPHELLANIYVPNRAVTRFEDITDDNLLDYADSVTFENASGNSMSFNIDDYVNSDQYESIWW